MVMSSGTTLSWAECHSEFLVGDTSFIVFWIYWSRQHGGKYGQLAGAGGDGVTNAEMPVKRPVYPSPM